VLVKKEHIIHGEVVIETANFDPPTYGCC